MAMRVRGDAMPYHSAIDSTMLTRASKLVSAVSSSPVQYNKAIVGRNAFAHESGIHQDGMLKKCANLRNHDARNGRRQQDVAGDGGSIRGATPSKIS